MIHTNIQGIFRKYLFYVLNILCLVMVLGGFLALNYVLAEQTVVSLHEQLHQIQFSDRLSVRLNLAVFTSQELLAVGDTSLIRNQLPSVQVETSLDDISLMRKQLTTAFETTGTPYATDLQNVIYTDVCEYLTGVQLLCCQAVQKGGDTFGLVNAASELETGVILRRDLYQASNKTVAARVGIQLVTVPNTVYPNNVMNGGTTVISDLIETAYENDLVASKDQTTLIWGVSCGIIVLVGLFAWFAVLTKIRQADGEFKRVLQTLPPNLILSNFMLKSYLLKTSRGALDFVKNDL